MKFKPITIPVPGIAFLGIRLNKKCPNCNGAGVEHLPSCGGALYGTTQVPCDWCDGRGGIPTEAGTRMLKFIVAYFAEVKEESDAA